MKNKSRHYQFGKH